MKAVEMEPYFAEMRRHLLPMLCGGHPGEAVAQSARNTLVTLTATQRQQVDALSKERGYRPFQAWHFSK